GLAGAADRNGVVYAIGGANSGGVVARVDAFDPATGAWTSRAPLPAPRFLAAAATASSDGRIYVLGGAHDEGATSVASSVSIYDPAANVWRRGPRLPSKRYELAAAAAPGKLFAIGGQMGTPIADVRTLAR